MPSFFAPSVSRQLTAGNRSRALAARQPLTFRIFLLGALLIAAFAAALSTAPAALAHDEMVSSAPAAGERFDTSPAELELVFSSPLMDLGNQIIVVDADGRDWVETAPVLNRETLVQPLPANLPNGEYSVRWRAVSSDGHPITGQFEFLVGADAVAGSAATAVPAKAGATETPTANASDEPAAAATDGTENTVADDGDTTPWLPIVIAGLAGLAVYVIFTVVVRRKRSRTE